MNRISPLIFFLMLSSFISKGQEPVQKVIFLVRQDPYGVQKLKSQDSIWYKEYDSDTLGKIRIFRISRDTLFFTHGLVTIPEISEIRIIQNDNIKKFNLSSWHALIPPESVYSSPEKIKSFERNITFQGSSHYGESFNYPEEKDYREYFDTTHIAFIRFDLFRLLWLEAFASFEIKLTSSISLETGVGWQFSDNGTLHIKRGSSDMLIFPFEGIIVTCGPKFYKLSERKPFIYLEPLLFFKYVWYQQMATKEPGNLNNYYYFGDQYRSVAGLFMNVGSSRKFNKVNLDLSIGVGIKYAFIEEVIFYTYYYDGDTHPNYKNPPVSKNINKISPIINFSIKLGFGL